MIGFPMEFTKEKLINYKSFSLGTHYTDDTVMTMANIAWLLTDNLTKEELVKQMSKLGTKYPMAGYGKHFWMWLQGSTDFKPYNSCGNGSAMRVSPVGWFFNTEEDVLKYAKISAEVTHNHPEGIKGAQSVAMAIYLARTGHTKQEIKKYIEENFGYNLNRTVEEIRPDYHFEVLCQTSVPEAIICFLEGNSTLEAIQLAISLGGDTDTQGAIAGSIAEAFYNDCDDLFHQAITQIDCEYPDEFIDLINKFNEKIEENK